MNGDAKVEVFLGGDRVCEDGGIVGSYGNNWGEKCNERAHNCRKANNSFTRIVLSKFIEYGRVTAVGDE